MVPAIEIESLTKTYKRRRAAPLTALDGLSLTVPAGQVFGLLGPNGAGKTTTIKMLCGLVKSTDGHVRLNGYDLSRKRSAAMRQIGAVLEGARNVYWRLTAWQNLMYFGGLKGQWGKRLKGRAERLLRDLDLWDRRSDPVASFSRGMQQKVAIACALVADPPILLLDEPTLGLDVEAARVVKRWIANLAAQEGKTVLLTTHQLDIAEKLCSRIAIISNGRMVADQPVGELLRLNGDHSFYEVRIKGHLNGHGDRFSGMNVREDNGETILSGAITDSPALHRVLGRIGALGLPLVSVTQAEPDLEEVFVRLTKKEA